MEGFYIKLHDCLLCSGKNEGPRILCPAKKTKTPKAYGGAQGLSGRVLDSRPRGRGFEPHRRHFVVVIEQDTFILAKYWFNPGRPVRPCLTERLLIGR